MKKVINHFLTITFVAVFALSSVAASEAQDPSWCASAFDHCDERAEEIAKDTGVTTFEGEFNIFLDCMDDTGCGEEPGFEF